MSLLAWSRSTPRTPSYFIFSMLLTSLVPLAGCTLFESNCEENDRDCLGGGYQRSGGACTRNGDCALGLNCEDEMCVYAASTKKGDECRATAECAKGLYCSKDVKCEAIADDARPEGGPCGTSADCEKGLVCDIEVKTLFTQGPFQGLDADCQTFMESGALPPECQLPKKCVARGDKDTGEACKKSAECLAGLYCVPNVIYPDEGNICGRSPEAMDQELISLPTWEGGECPADEKTPTAYFEVPSSAGENKDFYRLPFPNDIRIKANGKIDLSSHPVPPSDLDVPVVERFVTAAGNSLEGFATNPVIYFRFSEPYLPNNASLATSLRIVDITPGSPTYNLPGNIDWSPSGLSSHYICPNWIAFRRPIGTPLRPGTTYAAYITRTVKTMKDSKAYKRSPDLDAMLGSSKPSNTDLAKAYDKYKPLRDWLADSNVDADSLLNVAVFTTQKPEDVVPALREAVVSDGAPALSDMVVCDKDVKAPAGCEEMLTGRGKCHAKNNDFVEIYGHVALPIFQKGTPPYESPEQGGQIVLDGDGKAVKQSNMKVCFALSVPKAAAPAGGYPVVIYSHGTGGSFAGQTGGNGLAADLAKSDTPTALLAIDMPEHGSRRGDSTRPPEDLFFNFLNPEGARGNVLQGSADLMSLALLVRSGSISASESPTGDAIDFDASRVVVYGHSQGATHTAIMIPFEAGAQAGVLSGVGGHLASSLINKKKPVDISSILPFVLFDATDDGKLVGGLYNPMLSIVQMFFESADPINYARRVYDSPADSAPTGHHLFMTYGLNDSFSPEKTQEAYALAGGLTLITPALTDIKLMTAGPGATENARAGTTLRTVGVRQYDPTVNPVGGVAQDGHFVSSQTTNGRSDVLRFIQQVTAGQSPQIGE